MTSHTWIRRLFARTPRTVRKAPARFRPRLEGLEGRVAPAVLLVNSTADNTTDTSALTLREAITLVNHAGDPTSLGQASMPSGWSAQIDTTHSFGTQDRIVFDPAQVTSAMTLGGTQLELGKAITIDGREAGVTVDGNNASRIFQVDSGVQATLTNLTLSHGLVAGPGGAIFNSGTLTVSNCTLSHNLEFGANGGAVSNAGTMTVSNCTLSDNHAGGGGAIGNNGGTLTVGNCTLSGNGATTGGGIENIGGTLTVSNCTLSGNSGIGGGISMTGGTGTINNCTLYGNSSFTAGGGINNEGTLTVSDCTLSNNEAFRVGGGIDNSGTLTLNNTIVANSIRGDISGSYTGSHNLIGTVTLGPLADNGGPTQTMALLPGGPAIGHGDNTITGFPGTDQRGFTRVGLAADIGAYQTQANPFLVTTAADPGQLSGLLSLREAVNLANAYETAGDSAAIAFAAGVAGQTITLTQGQLELKAGAGTTSIDGGMAGVTVDGNEASRIFRVDSGVHATLNALTISHGKVVGNSGGGIDNGGTLTVTNCTLSGNVSLTNGGGIFNADTLTVSNSTLSGNSVANLGGGIFNGGTLTVSNSTLSDNSAHHGDGIATVALTLNNTIVANSMGGGDIYQLGGTITGSHNLVGDGSDGLSDTITGDPKLGDLGYYGGPTPTMALLPGSPALGKGDPTGAPNYDQRGPGFPRVVNGKMDIGAFEVQPISITTASLPGGTYGTTYTPTTITAAEAGISSFTFSVTGGAFPDGLGLSSNGTLSGTPTAVNSFTFTVTAKDSNGFTASQAFTVTIAAAPLTVTADSPSMTYGGTAPSLTYKYTGLVNGDTSATFTGALATTATSSSNAGNYDITQNTLAATGNYTIGAFSKGTLKVNPAPLTVTANNATKIQGEANPTFTVSFSGFVLNQDASVLGGTLTFTLTPTTGGCTITPGGVTSTNYDIKFVSGTLTVLSWGQATTNLEAQVDAAGLAQGMKNSLDSQLQAAIAYFTVGDTFDGVSQLKAFIHHVSAQSGNQINAALADALIAYAQRIIDAVG